MTGAISYLTVIMLKFALNQANYADSPLSLLPGVGRCYG